MSSHPHDLDAARHQEAELDAYEAALLRQDAQLRFRHAIAAAQVAALRDRQNALRLRKYGSEAPQPAGAPAVAEELEPRVLLSAAGGARLAVAAQRREHLAILAAALQNWDRQLTQAEQGVARGLAVEDECELAWQEREPAWRREGVPLVPSPTPADAMAVALPVVAPAAPLPEPAPPSDGVAAAATRMPLPRVTGRQSTSLAPGAVSDAQLGDLPLPRGPTKRMTTTPMFRPADSPTVTGALVVPASAPTGAAKAKSEMRSAAALPTVAPAQSPPPHDPEPQPRTRVLVDSAPEALARHAETVSIEPEGAEAVAMAARLRAKRRPENLPVRKRESRGLPSELPADLPTAHPQPPQRNRDATAPFLATLTYCGLPLMRQSIEYDPAGSNLLLSFHGAAPALQTDSELLWRDRDGTRHRFAVQVLQAVPAQGGGTVVVLDIGQWTAEDRMAMQTVMARLM